MPRPSSGPIWPLSDDPVETSLRRAYLRAPVANILGPATPDPMADLLARLSDALAQTELHHTG